MIAIINKSLILKNFYLFENVVYIFIFLSKSGDFLNTVKK